MLPLKFITNLTQKAYQAFGATYTINAYRQFEKIVPHLEPVISQLDPIRDSILDIGCGPGTLVEHLHQRGFKKIIGLDISEEAIREAANRVPPHMLLRQDFHQMNFPPGEFKAVFAINSLQYTSKQFLTQILKKIHLFLATKGVFFLVMPYGKGELVTEETYRDPETKQECKHAVYQSYYQEEELTKMLAEAGFSISAVNKLSDPLFSHILILIEARKGLDRR